MCACRFDGALRRPVSSRCCDVDNFALNTNEVEPQGALVHSTRPSTPVPVPMIRAWGTEHDVRVLNVAGPRASEVDGIYDAARSILDAFLSVQTGMEQHQ